MTTCRVGDREKIIDVISGVSVEPDLIWSRSDLDNSASPRLLGGETLSEGGASCLSQEGPEGIKGRFRQEKVHGHEHVLERSKPIGALAFMNYESLIQGAKGSTVSSDILDF